MEIENRRIFINGTAASFVCGCYAGGRLAIQLICDDGSPYGVLTVNLPYEELNDREIFVKTWSENKELAEEARKTCLFVDTGRRVPSGFVNVEVWKLADGVISCEKAPAHCYGKGE